jgi:hypothetical protein
VPAWSPADLLPGLYAGALGWLLAACLRRWFDGLPVGVLGGFALAIAVLLGPELFGGKILLPLDNLRGHVPFSELAPTVPHGNLLQGDLIELVTPSLAAVRQSLADGRWPLWNAGVGTGMPLLADPQSQSLAPLALAAMVFSPARGAAVVAALRLWTALLFTFLLWRSQGLGESAAFAGALAFGLSGFLLLWLGWPLANSAALLPAVLYGVVRCDQAGGRRDSTLLVLAATSLWLAGHPETIFAVALFALLFLLDRVRERPSGRRRELAGRVTLALLVSLCLAAPVLLAAADYLPKTLRAARLSETAAVPPQTGSSPAIPPLQDLALRWLPIVAPNAFGNSRFIHYWGLSNTNEDASGFVGTATLLAALLACRASRRFRQERLALVCAGFCLLFLAAPLAHPSGVAAKVLGSRRVLLLLAFCLAYLAACSWERWEQGERRLAATVSVAVALALLLVWAYVAHPHPTDPERLSVLRFGWLRWQERFLAVSAALLLFTPLRFRRLAVGALGVLVAAELLLAHRPANPPAPSQLAFPSTPPLAFLIAHGNEGRMAALGRALPPNLASLYGLRDARLYNPMAPAAYDRYLAPLIQEWWGEIPLFGAPGHPLYSQLGVRYLLTAPGAALPAPWQLAFAASSGWVYQRPSEELFRLTAVGTPASVFSRREATDAAIALTAMPAGVDRRLATSLYQDGGWTILADGRPAPPAPAEGPFVAALLPAGSRRLDLLYRPGAFLTGCLLAAFGLAALGALAAPPPTVAATMER